jgi:hypothetical protein
MKIKWLVTAVLLLAIGMAGLGITGFEGANWSAPATRRLSGWTPEELVEQGKQALYDHNILLAKEKFLAATASNPTDQQAQLFLGVVRIAALYENGQSSKTPALDSIREIAELFGVKFTSYNLYNTRGTWNDQILNTTPSTGKVLDFVAAKMLPEIDAALQNLSQVTDSNFSSTLSPAALARSGSDYTIDYADVLTIKAMAYAAKTALELTLAYNWDVNIPSIISADPKDLQDVRKLLVDRPAFATPKEPARLSAAKQAMHNYIDTFNSASNQITLRSGQTGHLFVFDTPVTNELATVTALKLDEFKSALADIDASLSGPHLYSFIKGMDNLPTVDLSIFFNGSAPINIRNKVIDFSNNTVLPDRTFGGVIPQGLVSQSVGRKAAAAEWEMNWKLTNAQSTLMDVAYNGSLYVAVGTNGSFGGIISTSRDGITWTRQSPIPYTMLYQVKWVGNMFVATGYDINNGYIFLRSSNGLTWIPESSEASFQADIAWGNGTFVRVGYDGIESSSDGVIWTSRYGEYINCVTWADSKFVALGQNNDYQAVVLTSTNGITWSENIVAALNANTDIVTGLVWAGGKFVAVGFDYFQWQPFILTSADASTWTKQTIEASRVANFAPKLSWGGGQFMAVGIDGMLTSPDGITWTQHDFLTNARFNGVTYGNGRFMVAGNRGIYVQTGAPVSSNTSHTVTTGSGTGGVITPASKVVKNGGSTTLTLKADYGYKIDQVSGCNGILTGTQYKTGPITADCTVTAEFNAIPMVLAITTKPPAAPLSYNSKTGVINFAVTGATTQEELAATVTASDAWITTSVFTYNGKGKGSLKYSINANPNSQPPEGRQGTITIAGQSYIISQVAKPCKLTLTQSSKLPLAASGGAMNVDVAIDPADGIWTVSTVKWVPATTPGWLQGFTLTDPQTGSGSLDLTADPNGSGKARSVVLTLQSSDLKSTKTVTVKQAK